MHVHLCACLYVHTMYVWIYVSFLQSPVCLPRLIRGSEGGAEGEQREVNREHDERKGRGLVGGGGAIGPSWVLAREGAEGGGREPWWVRTAINSKTGYFNSCWILSLSRSSSLVVYDLKIFYLMLLLVFHFFLLSPPSAVFLLPSALFQQHLAQPPCPFMQDKTFLHYHV